MRRFILHVFLLTLTFINTSKAQIFKDTLDKASISCHYSISACEGDTIEIRPNNLGQYSYTNVQWYFSSVLSSNNISQANVAFNVVDVSTSQIKITYPGGKYILTAEYESAAGCMALNDTISVSYTPKPRLSIVNNANSNVLCNGTSATLTTAITNSSGTWLYQWQASNNGVDFNDVSAATNATLTTPILSQKTYYRVKISQNDNVCGVITSPVSVLDVVNAPIANAGNDISQCSNIFTLNANTPSDGIGTWSIVGGNAIIADPHNPKTDVTISSETAILRWTIKVNSTCEDFDDVLLNLAEPLAFDQYLADINECIGGNNSLNAIIKGGTGIQTYQWQKSIDNNVWEDILNANNSSFVPPSDNTSLMYYRVNVYPTGLGCTTAVSNAAIVNIIPKPVVTITAATPIVCSGETKVQLNATISGGVDCYIQWQNSINNGDIWNDIPNATNNTYSVSNLSQTTKYRAVVTCNGNGCCE